MFEQAMFTDSLLETSWAHRSRRSWTTLTLFGVQSVVIGLLLLIPILTTVGLPTAVRVLPTPISWGAPPPAAPPIQQQHVATLNQSNFIDHVLITPPSIPKEVAIVDETTEPPQISYNTNPGVEGGTGAGSDGVWKSINDSLSHVAPVPVVAAPTIKRTFRTSSMLQGSLIRRVEPVYPPLARSARIQGTVILAAVISKAGTIENLRLISGHPMLVPAAIDAVSQWRYKPYILNDEAIEVETRITVNFVLGGS